MLLISLAMAKHKNKIHKTTKVMASLRILNIILKRFQSCFKHILANRARAKFEVKKQVVPRIVPHVFFQKLNMSANPTHRRLSKMVGRSVENEIEIRADIKTRALLSRGSMDIYADIFTVYVSNSMSFSTVCRQVRDFSAGVGSVTSAPKYCRSKSASSPKTVIKKYSKIRHKDILLSRLRTWLAFQKHLHCAFDKIFGK